MSNNEDEPFLAPIEEPHGLLMKLAYSMSRWQFSKVLTPLKVIYARMPLAFGMFGSKISKLDEKLILSRELVMLVREHVAHLNVCTFCTDIARSMIIKQGMNEAKFDALENYQTSSLFSDAERAVLDYVTELTRDKQVDPQTFERLASFYSERQICEIVWLVASEHFYNISNIGLNIHSDMLCDISKRHQAQHRTRA